MMFDLNILFIPLFFSNLKRKEIFLVYKKQKKNLIFNNTVFNSRLSMKYYQDIIYPEVLSNKIEYVDNNKKFILQPSYKFHKETIPEIVYTPDFYIKYKNGKEEIIDVNDKFEIMGDGDYLKKIMFNYLYPNFMYIHLTYSSLDGGWNDYTYVKKQIKKRNKIRKLNGKQNGINEEEINKEIQLQWLYKE
jgi:hypothetical protein